MRAVIANRITGDLPGSNLKGVQQQPLLQGLPLADPEFDKPGQIHMLIGADILDQVILGGRRSTAGADLHAWKTIFGCSVRGHCQADSQQPPSHVCMNTSPLDKQTNELLTAFWRAEEAPSDHLIQSAEEQQALEYFQSTHTREPEGRYVVKLPKRSVSVSRRCSRDQAVRRYK